MNLNWAKHFLTQAQAAGTPKELANALNQAAEYRRRAVTEYTNYVKAERTWAARKALFAATADAQQIDWIKICAMPVPTLLEALSASEVKRLEPAIASQGRAFAAYLQSTEVA